MPRSALRAWHPSFPRLAMHDGNAQPGRAVWPGSSQGAPGGQPSAPPGGLASLDPEPPKRESFEGTGLTSLIPESRRGAGRRPVRRRSWSLRSTSRSRPSPALGTAGVASRGRSTAEGRGVTAGRSREIRRAMGRGPGRLSRLAGRARSRAGVREAEGSTTGRRSARRRRPRRRDSPGRRTMAPSDGSAAASRGASIRRGRRGRRWRRQVGVGQEEPGRTVGRGLAAVRTDESARPGPRAVVRAVGMSTISIASPGRG